MSLSLLCLPYGANAQDGIHLHVLMLEEEAPGGHDDGEARRHPGFMGASVLRQEHHDHRVAHLLGPFGFLNSSHRTRMRRSPPPPPAPLSDVTAARVFTS